MMIFISQSNYEMTCKTQILSGVLAHEIIHIHTRINIGFGNATCHLDTGSNDADVHR
jgi:hypothetical protein